MRKLFVITLSAVAAFTTAVAHAQYYYNTGSYYNYGSYNSGGYNTGRYNTGYSGMSYHPAQAVGSPNTTYHTPQAVSKQKQREIGQISVGADYVRGYASYKTVDFVVDSALTGGEPYVSDTRDFDRGFNSISFNIGWRPLRYVGLEAFYSTSLDDNKVTHTESYTHYPEFARGEYSVSYKVYGLDLLGYIPINDYIEFIASIGVGKYDAKAKVKVNAYEDSISFNPIRTTSKNFEDSAWAYRIGGGFQIWMSKHLALRVMGRWSQIGGDFMDYITEINVGVRYHF